MLVVPCPYKSQQGRREGEGAEEAVPLQNVHDTHSQHVLAQSLDVIFAGPQDIPTKNQMLTRGPEAHHTQHAAEACAGTQGKSS